MLKSLQIQNVALISKLNIDMTSGLNIITGETGAGKSIIIDSINLVLGERAERELIKYGESKARVEATFDVSDNESALAILDEQEIEPDDGDITISRELGVSATNANSLKSVCRINGVMVNIAVQKSVTEQIVDLHGQHEHQSLLSPKRHIGYLDAYAGKNAACLKARTQKAYSACRALERELLQGFVSEEEKARKIDILSFQINEIEAARLESDEEERLESEREVLSNSEHIIDALSAAAALLTGEENGALYAVKDASRRLERIANLSKQYETVSSALNEAYYALEDAAYSVRDLRDEFTFNPELLDDIESRLNTINMLKRKYGGSIPAILRFLNDARAELDELTNADERRQQLADELKQNKAEYMQAALALSDARRAAADTFSSAVIDELKQLGLNKARFSVSFKRLTEDFSDIFANGIDEIEFMLSANPGEPEKPLSKVASGGEMSRIMLALKTVLSGCEPISLMIFDEIDTGISGETASIVGKKMKELSRTRQIIAITHLPQIAAYADHHYLVEKTQSDNTTTSTLRLLTEKERCTEIARIMGSVDELSVEHARAMIANAK